MRVVATESVDPKIGLSFGGGQAGLWFTTGQDLRGKTTAVGVDLPQCSRAADALISFKAPEEAPINEALDDVEQALRNLAGTTAVSRRRLRSQLSR